MTDEIECYECFTVADQEDADGWEAVTGDPVACIPAHWLCEDCS